MSFFAYNLLNDFSVTSDKPENVNIYFTLLVAKLNSNLCNSNDISSNDCCGETEKASPPWEDHSLNSVEKIIMNLTTVFTTGKLPEAFTR